VTYGDDDRWVTVHLGLATWVEAPRADFDQFGRRRTERTQCYGDECGKIADALFHDECGLTIAQAERALRKLREAPYREHRKHGGMEWRDGYPGESLCFCKCGHVIDSSFNESAII